MFVRDKGGEIGPSATAKGDYYEMMRKAALAPRSPGKRKGVAEFEDLRLGANKQESSQAAEQRLYYRRDGEFSEMYNNAARYPNKPRPFEPKMMRPAGVGSGFGCPRPPPRQRVSEQVASSLGRTRRPHSAGNRVFSASPTNRISAPPTSAPVVKAV
jgi:hypothetical protein